MQAASPLPEGLQFRCCIVGGGPAGMMLGFLLARAGIDLVVLEKHADFLRDFRGDTLHPSTLETMNELGILEELLKRPHQKISQVRVRMGRNEEAMGVLQQRFAKHKYGLAELKVNPFYDPLRRDPRFQDLLRRVGLAE